MKKRLALCVLLASPAAFAERDTASAQVMFDQARDAMKKGDFARACPKFAESQRLDPQPGTLANLAVCEEKRGAIASAWTHARDAAEQLGSGDERVPPLRALIARVEKRLPKLLIKLAPGSPKGTKVTRDGVELGAASLGEALPVDPGAHAITTSAPGYASTTVTVTVAERASKEVEVSPGEREPATAAAPPGETHPRATAPLEPRNGHSLSDIGSRQKSGYAATGVGAVGATVALVTGVILSGKQSTVKANCDTTAKVCSGPDTQAARDAASSGQALLPVFYGGLAVGVVGLGAGAYLLLSGEDAKTAVRVGPGGVSVKGRF